MREHWTRYQNEAHCKTEQDQSLFADHAPSSKIRNLGRLKIMSDSCRTESQSHLRGAPAILPVATLYIDLKFYNLSLQLFRVHGFIVAKPEAGIGPSPISEYAVIREV